MNFNKLINNRLLTRNNLLIKYRNKSKSSSEYCLDLVKQHDYENFVCTILLKNTARSNALAIRGFNVEVARVAEQVSQENIGLMRLKFWEDTIEKCFTKDVKAVPQHPVAIELFKAINRMKLTKRHFMSLINARKNQLGITGFKNLEDIEKYAEQSVSCVYYLILESCGVKDLQADHAASHLGKAQGIVQQLRSTPHARRLNFLPLPQDILIKNKISTEDILRARSSEKLNDCTYEVASRAHQHLVKARNLLDKVPVNGRKALLPAIPIFNYLDRLQKINYDVFHPSLKHRTWKLLPSLWFASIQNKY